MPILPLFGHVSLRERLSQTIARGALPGSLLLHGPQGVGKQRLALWLGQLLLCDEPSSEPCGRCKACRYTTELAHPDLHWYFPRPRSKDSDPDAESVVEDLQDAARERLDNHLLYPPAPGNEGIYVSTVQAIVHQAGLTPAMAKRKVFVIGDADHMVQGGTEYAANSFLKLLEEPSANTTLILTSSEAGALLPTIRSRVSAIRVAPLQEPEVLAWMQQDHVREALATVENLPDNDHERVRLSAGAPGSLLGASSRGAAHTVARRLLEAAGSSRATRLRVAFAQGATGARGEFTAVLDELSLLLADDARKASVRGDNGRALRTSRAMSRVETAKERAAANITPQVTTAALLRELSEDLA